MKAGRKARVKFTVYAWIALPVAATGGGCSGIESGSVWAPQSAAYRSLGSTFAWMPMVTVSEDNPEIDPMFRELIREMVEDGFAAKGYEQTSVDAAADFWIGCQLKKLKRGSAYADGFSEYDEATMAVYVVSPVTRQTLWKGWAQARLKKDYPPDDKRERLQEALDKILHDLPSRDMPLRKGNH